jgi:hypothetical protein
MSGALKWLYICAHKPTSTAMNNATKRFEVKIGRNWKKVRATSMAALSAWAKANGATDWSMLGMASRSEIQQSLTWDVVA